MKVSCSNSSLDLELRTLGSMLGAGPRLWTIESLVHEEFCSLKKKKRAASSVLMTQRMIFCCRFKNISSTDFIARLPWTLKVQTLTPEIDKTLISI